MPMCSHHIPLEEKCSRCVQEGLKREDERLTASRQDGIDRALRLVIPLEATTSNAIENFSRMDYSSVVHLPDFARMSHKFVK
ncbi:MAG TPA: hypothetical protein VM532_15870 [Burkholderiales bacterium]|nr:hypothetical protein [Burkholderiales bacterium]